MPPAYIAKITGRLAGDHRPSNVLAEQCGSAVMLLSIKLLGLGPVKAHNVLTVKSAGHAAGAANSIVQVCLLNSAVCYFSQSFYLYHHHTVQLAAG